MHSKGEVDRREPCSELRKDRETSPKQVPLDIRQKNGGEAGETKGKRRGHDWHIVVEAFCK